MVKKFKIALIFLIVTLSLYVFAKYDIFQKPITSVELVFSEEVSKKDIPLIYISSDEESKINFETVYKFQSTKNFVYQCQLDETKKIRKLRFYFPYPNRDVLIKSIRLKSSNKVVSIPLRKFKKRIGINYIELPNDFKLEILEKNGYIELPKTYFYTSDLKNIYQFVLPLVGVLILIVLTLKSLKTIAVKPFCISSITLSLLVLSLFLPAPIYNVALILLAALNLKNISWAAIKSHKINLIIIGFFIIYFLNNLLISKESFHQMSTIERFLPFIILGVVLPSIANRKFLALFPVSAFVIGFGFLLTSIFDAYIHKNFVFLSFDLFAKYLHPVYFSYLLFFSICYIDLNYTGKKKYFLEFILFLFLIFSGSKMVFLFSLFVVFINLLKNKKTALLIIPLAVIVVLFSPLKERFDEILKEEGFSVLNEKHIENPYDARINGLTLRLVLWRETLATMKGLDYIFGKGVTNETNKLLEKRLDKLGLKKHLGFNPHNQYVDTFWRTGVIGLVLLILILFYCLKDALIRKDKLLILFSLFFIAVMFSESIFGRVNGIYFFTTVILLLMNSNKFNEDSHIRN